jgi:AraC-like DNA-binding protein
VTAPSAQATDGLQAALEQTQLEGALFLHSEFTEAWAYESPAAGLEAALHPGAERLIIFHLVGAGRCWISLSGGERLWAEEGDVIVLPYGDQHRVGGTDDADVTPIMQLLRPPPWDSFPAVQLGGGGERTEIVCGYLHSKDPLFDVRLRAFPPVFVVRPPEGPLAEWIRSNIRFAADLAHGNARGGLIALRLPELLLIEVLRMHLASAPAAETGWVAAFRDPVLAPAMARIHGTPEHDWSVSELAGAAAVSRSVLDERFRNVLGLSPIRYLAEWRLHLADGLLSRGDLSVAAVAHRVGYQSEEAFSRAFKRARGVAPSHWRSRVRAANR